MAKQFKQIEPAHAAFIAEQHIFFTASAAATGRINISPRGADAFRVLNANTVAYLDQTGSGNETAAHLRASGRLTIMFCGFENVPMILRLYGHAGAPAEGVRRTTRRCWKPPSATRNRPARARSSVWMSRWCRQAAVTGCPCSTTGRSGRPCADGRKIRVRRASPLTGGRKMFIASTGSRPVLRPMNRWTLVPPGKMSDPEDVARRLVVAAK